MTADSARNTTGCLDDSIAELISDFHDGRYPPGSPEALRVEEHLARCPSCEEMLEDFRLLTQATRVLCASECPPGDSECYVRCVRDAIRRRSLRRRLYSTGLTTGVAAAVAAVVTIAVFFSRTPAVVADPQEPEVSEVVASLPVDTGSVRTDLDVTEASDPRDIFNRLEEAMLLDRGTAGRRPGILPVGVVAPDATVQPRVLLGVYADGIYAGEGVRVAGIVPGSPAHAAGIRPGDVIVEAAGEALAGATGTERLRELVLAAGPGASLALLISRDGTTRRVEAVLAGR